MARPRRQSPQLAMARRYIRLHMPDLEGASLRVRQIDGPPDAPRFAVTAELCQASQCPFRVSREQAEAGQCTVAECAARHTVRMLMMRNGEVIQVTTNDRHWR